MTHVHKPDICASAMPYHHCICRCVRRAYLCGEDPLTGKEYSHRKAWLLERFDLLARVFCIDLCAYAVLPDHYHLFIQINQSQAISLTDEEVIFRWQRLFVVPSAVIRWHLGQADCAESETARSLVALWRQHLVEIAWYMRCLNEHIARLANSEDGCKGRFWEGRFKTRAIANEADLLARMTTVGLDPVIARLDSGQQGSGQSEAPDRFIHQRLMPYPRLYDSQTAPDANTQHPSHS